MSIKLVDFKDIVDTVMEELKLQSSDTVNEARIQRIVNEIYINEVVPHARWKWLEGHAKVKFKEAYGAGTASVTPSSSTITLSVSPAASWGSFAGYYFSVIGHNEVYIIDSHTAESTTVTLTSNFLGTLDSTASFKIWTDKVALPADCRETVTVWHNMYNRPMDAMGWQKFRELSINNPKAENYPRVYYTGDYVGELDASRYRELRVHPAIYSSPVTISVDYVRDVSELVDDGDEPVIPIEDRIVLKYGALSQAWRSIGRNPEEANINYQLFKQKLERMAGKIEDSHDKPQLQLDSLYMRRRRAPRYKIGAASADFGSSGGNGNSSNIQFLQDAIIQGAQITADVTVDTGVTIDGVDISVLEDDFAAHLVDAVDAHDASAISVSPSGNLTATDVQAALVEIQTELDGKATSAEITNHINDTTDAHDASAISFLPVGSIAATDAQTAIAEVATDAASALSTHEADTTSIHGIADTSLLVTTTGSQTLTNKTIAFASNTLTGVQPTSTLTTKGDIYVATASATVTRRGVGSDGQVLTADSAQADGIKWATPASSPTSAYEISNLTLTTSVGSSALTIAVKTQAGADPSSGDPVKIGFRSSTLTSGVYNQRTISSSLSLVISSGSTLGMLSGKAARLFIYLIDNSGTPELAISQWQYPETNLVSTTAEGGAGAADSATVIYSTTARSNVPIRLIGTLDNTQTTAGTWASAGTRLNVGDYATLTSERVSARYVNSSTPISGTLAKITYSTLDFDSHSMYSGGTATIPISGDYQINNSIQYLFSSAADVANALAIYKDGVEVSRQQENGSSGTTGNTMLSGSDIIRCTGGQTIEIYGSSAGSSPSINSSTTRNYVSITRIT